MVDKWIVFGGWALGADPLKPLFGTASTFIDSNRFMPRLICDGALVANWPVLFAKAIAPLLPDAPYGIAGWSLGALLAYAVALRSKPAACIFISATPSFCRKPGFPYGQKEMVLKAMREQLAMDPAQVVKKFSLQCGIEPPSLPKTVHPAELSAGLTFLQHATLLPVEKLPRSSLFLHGKDDTIIPAQAGRFLCSGSSGIFAEFTGPHAFFMSQRETVADAIQRFGEKVIA